MFFFLQQLSPVTPRLTKSSGVSHRPPSLSLSLSLPLCVFFWAIIFPSLLALCRETSDAPGHARVGVAKKKGWLNRRMGWTVGGVGAAGCLSFTRRSRVQSRLGTGQQRESGKRRLGKGRKKKEESVKDKDDAQLTWFFSCRPNRLTSKRATGGKEYPSSTTAVRPPTSPKSGRCILRGVLFPPHEPQSPVASA